MPQSLKVGDLLRQRYRILERIGQGGMGNIYLADDIRLAGRRCALKEVEHDRSLPEKILREAREQFMREATVLARLDHPNLPKVSDFFTQNFRDYLVMDFVPGKDLRTIMLEARQKNTFLAEAEVLNWASQLSDALTYLHSQSSPVLHRDIKPSNLKITPDGLLKLVDFGLVKMLVPDEKTITIIHGQGTALYTPLEQYGGADSHTDVRSDVFSFGSTLYHLLACQPPVDARMRFISPDSLVSIRSLNPAVSVRTERAVAWAMALHPNDRPESVEEFRRYLLGTQDLPVRPSGVSRPRLVSLMDALSEDPENSMVWIASGLLLLSLITTLGR